LSWNIYMPEIISCHGRENPVFFEKMTPFQNPGDATVKG
jgi:hypothetical protein